MPKKYRQKSLLTKPSSSAPSSLALSKASASDDGSSTKTVNDLIRDSRRATANEKPQTVHTSSSIPPSLRLVLDIPTPPPPPPRLGIRGPIRLRRVPGPPPPRSWLIDSAHAPSQVRNVPWSKAHERTRTQKQCCTLPDGAFPSAGSLQHIVMKSMASNWSWHAEYDHEYLAELPTNVKETMLSYIAIYSDKQSLSPVRLLFPPDLAQDELDGVSRLDLGNAVGNWSTIKRLEKELESDEAMKQERSVSHGNAGKIPEAWDSDTSQESDKHAILQYVPPNGLRFRCLKHLSLAVAPGTSGSTASWSVLLKMATKLSTITSLSLAYWPQPTYTPHASSSMVRMGSSTTGPSTPSYGGTNFYTALDNDWKEAAGMLRTLSRSLYCLEWLDLTGCGHWFQALTWKPVDGVSGDVIRPTGPDWNGSWRSVERVVLAVGWSPGPPPTEPKLQSKSSEIIPRVNNDNESGDYDDRPLHLLSQRSSTRLGSRRTSEVNTTESWNVEFEREKYYYRLEARRYIEVQDRAKVIAQELRSIRKEHGGKWIDVDYGSVDDIQLADANV